MKNILCVLDLTENSHYTLERLPAIYRALEKFGKEIQVTFLDIYKFEELFGPYISCCLPNYKFIEYVQENKIATIFTSSELFEFVSPDTIDYLEKTGVVVSCVLGDDENNFSININYLGLLTIPIGYQKEEVGKYLLVNPNTYLLPIGVSFDNTEKYLGQTKMIDILFVGRPYSRRPHFIKFIEKNKINVSVYGSNKWRKYLSEKIYKGFLDNNDYYKKISQAKLYLAMLESPKCWERLHINAKPFDAAKVGAALIVTKYEKFAESYNLIEGKDFFSYQSEIDLVQKIKFLLANDDIREEISLNLRLKLKKYDYDQLYFEYFRNLISFETNALPNVKLPRVLILNKFTRAINNIDQYDYVIFNNSSHIQYASALRNVLSAHLNTNKIVKLDSTYKAKIVRKVFSLVDLPSLAIPVDRVGEIKVFMGLAYVKNSSQTFIALNNYSKFNFYIYILIIIRYIYKKLS